MRANSPTCRAAAALSCDFVGDNRSFQFEFELQDGAYYVSAIQSNPLTGCHQEAQRACHLASGSRHRARHVHSRASPLSPWGALPSSLATRCSSAPRSRASPRSLAPNRKDSTVCRDEVLAAAILDLLLHHSHTLLIQGDSYRLKQKRKAGLVPKAK